MRGIPFTKMHGLGNDYLFVDGADVVGLHLPDLARAMSDRHRGIGADGIIVLDVLTLPCTGQGPGGQDAGQAKHVKTGGTVRPAASRPPRPQAVPALQEDAGPRGDAVQAASEEADVDMRIFNADGGAAEVCGNGLRCAARRVFERGAIAGTIVRVRCGGRVLAATCRLDAEGRVAGVHVRLGSFATGPAAVDAVADRLDAAGPGVWRLRSGTHPLHLVSVGNPHAIAFVDDPGGVDIATAGRAIECDPAFPEHINVHFARAGAGGELTMRSWERGAGATLACGSGAAAVAVAALQSGRTGADVIVHLAGGDLRVTVDERACDVAIEGAAEPVFSGRWRAGADATGHD